MPQPPQRIKAWWRTNPTVVGKEGFRHCPRRTEKDSNPQKSMETHYVAAMSYTPDPDLMHTREW
jgi:hypothetical protein